MSLSIPGRIFAGFVALLLTFGGVSGYTAWQVSTLGTQVGHIHRALLPLPPLIAEIKSDLKGLDLVLEQRDPALLRRSVHLARRVHPYLERLAEHFARGRESLGGGEPVPDLPPLHVRFAALDAERAALAEETEAFFNLVEADGDPTAALRVARRRLLDLGREIARFEIDLDAVTDRAVTDFEREERRAVWGTILLTAVGMVLGLVLTLSAGLTLRPLRTLREGVERIARGEYDQPIRVATRDELGALAADFNRMAEAIRKRDAQLSAQQTELLHQERLATVGRMSAQITHELRNPLSSIGLNSELLMEELAQLETPAEATAEARTLLGSIIQEVERLREITEAYLRFARLPRPEPVPVDLNHAASELLDFLRTELEQAHVKARVDADRAARPALVDPNQLRAALLNLVRNTREALHPKGGHVVLRVRTLGSQATVEVIDDGPGLSPEARAHLFEPFFSTKPQGTGLGLSFVRKIVQAQGGEVEVEDAPGRGTLVRLRLPLADSDAAASDVA